MSRYRYRWKDRHDDLVKRENPWPLRIEFVVLAGLSLWAIGTGFWSAAHRIIEFFS